MPIRYRVIWRTKDGKKKKGTFTYMNEEDTIEMVRQAIHSSSPGVVVEVQIEDVKSKQEKPFFDMLKCPDCGWVQEYVKKVGDECDNPDCESYVVNYHGKKRWNNPNWG